MATIVGNVLDDWKYPSVQNNSITVSATAHQPLAIVALEPFTEGQGLSGKVVGTPARGGRHLFLGGDCQYSGGAGTNVGRWQGLYTIGGSTLATGLTATQKQLQGDTNVDPMDTVVMDGTVFCADGVRRHVHPGDYDQPLKAFKFIASGSVWTDLTSDLSSETAAPPEIIGTATGDIFYLGYGDVFGRARFFVHQVSGGLSGVSVWEYSKGSGAWGTLTINDPCTKFSLQPAADATAYAAYYNPTQGVHSGLVTPLANDGDLWFTIPADFAADTVNGQLGYYIRLRVTNSGTSQVPKLARCWVYYATATTRYASAAYRITDNPGSYAPAGIGWGIDLPGCDRDQHVPPVFKVGGTYYSRTHADPAVTKVRLFSAGTTLATLIAEEAINTTLTTTSFTVTSSAVPFTLPLALASNPKAGIYSHPDKPGAFRTVCKWRDQIFFGGSPGQDATDSTKVKSFRLRYGWTYPGYPHHAGGYADVQGGDGGDEILCMRTLNDVVIVLTRNRVYRVTPTGSATIPPTVYEVHGVPGIVGTKAAWVHNNTLYWAARTGVMRMTAGGQVEALPITRSIQTLWREALRTNEANFGNVWLVVDPTRNELIVTMPGVQAQFGASGSSDGINDGLLFCHLETFQWGVSPGEYVSAMTVARTAEGRDEVVFGSYRGEVYVYKAAQAFGTDGPSDNSLSYTGTATGGSSTTLVDSGATFPSFAAGDTRFHEAKITKITTAGASETRRVKAATTTQITVDPAWTTAAVAGDTYKVGGIPFAVETGDLSFGVPNRHKAIEKVDVQTDRAKDSAHIMDIAVDPTPVEHTGTGYTTGDGTAGTTYPLAPLFIGPVAGRTQRLKVYGLVGRTSASGTQERPEITGFTLRVRPYAVGIAV